MRPELLREFVRDHCHLANGHAITFAEFRQRFHAWLPRGERYQWTNYHLSRQLRNLGIPVGARSARETFLGNISWTQVPPAGEFVMLEKRKQRRLVLCNAS